MTDQETRIYPKNGAPDGERRLSIALLGVLALVAGVMLFVQGRYDPGTWREQAQTVATDTAAPSQGTTPAGGERDVTAGWEPLSAAERYTGDTLSDKINGKADLYLSAGFQGLESRRFALAGDQGRWAERYVYDMGSLHNAYAVFSSQRRPNAHALEVTAHAYLAGNGLFFVHGPFYVEIIAAEASPEVHKGMERLAEAFIASHDAKTEDLAELRLFPDEQRMAGGIKLTARSAFGIEGLDGIFTADYAADQARALGFVSRRASAAEAESLSARFHAFWIEFGAEAVAAPAVLRNARIALILDNYEMALVQGTYLIGVHEATDLEFGLALIKKLQGRIAGLSQ
jgi:hypothetical protein